MTQFSILFNHYSDKLHEWWVKDGKNFIAFFFSNEILGYAMLLTQSWKQASVIQTSPLHLGVSTDEPSLWLMLYLLENTCMIPSYDLLFYVNTFIISSGYANMIN